ncbi:hypothetical protein [Marinicrinis sediminis]|uniref:Uncharacterized protein n=1 Tax=Marinicrinis sediminis TaxID=1652465 RepID=A0ABW5RBS7_9BACL
MSEKEFVYINGDKYRLVINSEGEKCLICDKNSDGFKMTIHLVEDPISLKSAQEALDRFVVNCLL